VSDLAKRSSWNPAVIGFAAAAAVLGGSTPPAVFLNPAAASAARAVGPASIASAVFRDLRPGRFAAFTEWLGSALRNGAVYAYLAGFVREYAAWPARIRKCEAARSEAAGGR